jgi:hypothetical protein
MRQESPERLLVRAGELAVRMREGFELAIFRGVGVEGHRAGLNARAGRWRDGARLCIELPP